MTRWSDDDSATDPLPVYDLSGSPEWPARALDDAAPPDGPGRGRVLALVALAGLALTLVVVSRLTAGRSPAPPALVLPSGWSSGTRDAAVLGAQPVRGADDGVTSLVIGRRGVYFLERSAGRLGHLDAGALAVQDDTTVPIGADGLALDSGGDVLWVFAPQTGGYTDLRRFDLNDSTGTLRSTKWSERRLASSVSGALSVDGTAWLTTPTGLVAVSPVRPSPASPSGLRITALPVGRVESAIADIDRGRIVFTTSTATGSLLQWAAAAAHGRPQAHRTRALSMRDTTLALVGGALWVAGVDGRPRLTRLDVLDGSDTPGEVRSSPGGLGRLSNGGDVLWWASLGSGLSCLRPMDAGLVHTWPDVTGPAVSAVGYIYAVARGQLNRLESSNDCPG